MPGQTRGISRFRRGQRAERTEEIGQRGQRQIGRRIGEEEEETLIEIVRRRFSRLKIKEKGNERRHLCLLASFSLRSDLSNQKGKSLRFNDNSNINEIEC